MKVFWQSYASMSRRVFTGNEALAVSVGSLT